MIKIGMLIGDRYEVLEKIGTGGMSDVYKAKDHKLNRCVAMKVLKQEFSENSNFVMKFTVEAQAAAGLMHPNIVNVYDVGEEDGIHYIVMELVDGITLKRYIEKKARLSVKEAISIAIQVSMGIEAAHNNHIIHRDIKPQNIIISKEGKVKVTDFGIAKAATSNTITSNVMGSVHYTSPEQARGGYSDEKSDIYSLGITLFEMLTGRVPFNGETTVAIAIKHIQEEMPSPRDFVPEIPVSVEQIVFKCTQKSPDRRYQTMGELIGDLKKSLISPDEGFVKVVDFAGQEETKLISDSDMVQIKKQSQKTTPPAGMKEAPVKKQSKNTKKSSKPRQEKNERLDKYEKYDKYDKYDDDDYDPKMEKVTTVLTIIVAIVIGCVLLFLAGRAMGIFPAGTETEESTTESSGTLVMPEVVGKSLADASAALEAQGITYEITYDVSTKYSKNTVTDSSVEKGTAVEKGQTVTLTVSAGADGVKVPSVTGLSEAEATASLEKEGFTVKKVISTVENGTKGNVIAQSPEAGNIISRDGTVTITICGDSESDLVQVPEVRGMTAEAAKAALEASGLVCGTVTETENAEYDAGTVCYQSFSAGTEQEKETVVDLRVSLGATYACNINVPAPADYQGGNATVVLSAADTGAILFNTTTSIFPVAINISGITTTDTGIVTISYSVPVNPPQTDENGQTVTSKVVAAEETVPFTKE
ncbi:MAG: Stk1 family PASTA domain-containing Ser/Thr kinase [Lachnospiraceae bacterium]|nr:Stk1 family PASTA domain-containing Ser/Thr kinase [Lachnospiraceae bacterium]